jgi:hypothetical protein
MFGGCRKEINARGARAAMVPADVALYFESSDPEARKGLETAAFSGPSARCDSYEALSARSALSLLSGELLPALDDHIAESRLDLDRIAAAVQLLGSRDLRAAASEGFEAQLPRQNVLAIQQSQGQAAAVCPV